MFEYVARLGTGAFGEVDLVRKRDSGVLFALKTLRKRDVLRRNQAAHVKAERDILAEADNEWVVKLYYSFQVSLPSCSWSAITSEMTFHVYGGWLVGQQLDFKEFGFSTKIFALRRWHVKKLHKVFGVTWIEMQIQSRTLGKCWSLNLVQSIIFAVSK